jgi:hypothetical protein
LINCSASFLASGALIALAIPRMLYGWSAGLAETGQLLNSGRQSGLDGGTASLNALGSNTRALAMGGQLLGVGS